MIRSKVISGEIKESRKVALHYMAALVEVAREAFLILDADLRVVSANPIFYTTFQVSLEETKNEFVYDLGNGQWDIPALRSLLEKILPDQKTVQNYEVAHTFESIGEKTMLLNAQQMDSVQLIVLAIEDITERKQLERKLAEYTKGLEVIVANRTKELAQQVQELAEMNQTMVGRELKMVELKKENKDLRNKDLGV